MLLFQLNEIKNNLSKYLAGCFRKKIKQVFMPNWNKGRCHFKITIELRICTWSPNYNSPCPYCNFRPSRDIILQQSMTHWYHQYTNSSLNIAIIRFGLKIAIDHSGYKPQPLVYGLLQNWCQLEGYNLSLSQDRPL